MKNMNKFFLAWSLCVASSLASADMVAPDALVRDTAQVVLDAVKQDKEMQTGSSKKLLDLVEAKVLPHFDFERMTRLAVGKAWRTATAEQRQTLVVEFRTLIVRTYTAAFSGYRNQSIKVDQAQILPGGDEATVKTQIITPGSPAVAVDYEMEKTADGWKAFDLTVEGVSLISNYRSSFNEQVQQSGIDGLIKSLVDKNHANAGKPLRKADSK